MSESSVQEPAVSYSMKFGRQVDRGEFLSKMLVKLGKASREDIDEILAQFDILDGACRYSSSKATCFTTSSDPLDPGHSSITALGALLSVCLLGFTEDGSGFLDSDDLALLKAREQEQAAAAKAQAVRSA